jgi:hypothetical protein
MWWAGSATCDVHIHTCGATRLTVAVAALDGDQHASENRGEGWGEVAKQRQGLVWTMSNPAAIAAAAAAGSVIGKVGVA